MPEMLIIPRLIPGEILFSQPSRGSQVSIEMGLIPGSIMIDHKTSGAVVMLTERVGRNVIFGLQRIKEPGADLNEYILQETGFNIDLEDGSGSILKE